MSTTHSYVARVTVLNGGSVVVTGDAVDAVSERNVQTLMLNAVADRFSVPADRLSVAAWSAICWTEG